MLSKTLMGAVAAFLLLGASNASARDFDVDVYRFVGVQGDVELTVDRFDFCSDAIDQLRELSFELKEGVPIGLRRTALFFENSSDSVILFCEEVRRRNLLR